MHRESRDAAAPMQQMSFCEFRRPWKTVSVPDVRVPKPFEVSLGSPSTASSHTIVVKMSSKFCVSKFLDSLILAGFPAWRLSRAAAASGDANVCSGAAAVCIRVSIVWSLRSLWIMYIAPIYAYAM